ncbi:isoprenoid synthase domain-containing protein [Immersiella caudata]|uniref:Terpene synthase n=1 Tax=Immersiella caudata TaxID=314043 RepID=A0AA39WD74_9PEZI|nr:isoprenoid synthase domain-containing protein [Immersiella caudata]
MRKRHRTGAKSTKNSRLPRPSPSMYTTLQPRTSRNQSSSPTQPKPRRQVSPSPTFSPPIMTSDVRVNPHYAKVKRRADARVARIMMKDDNWAAKNAKVDLAFLASAWCFTCDGGTLDLAMDWNHWVFLFDDQFDEGHLMTDLTAAEDEIEKTVAVMRGTLRVSAKELPVRYMMQTISDGVRKNSTPEFQKHWINMHQLYYSGLLQQVNDTQAEKLSSYTIQEYIELRVRNIGVYPAIALTQYAEGVTSLPEHILQHPSLQECMRVCAELVVLVNDIASFKKDVALDMDLNIINLTRKGGHGLTTQQAMDQTFVEMLHWEICIGASEPDDTSEDRKELKCEKHGSLSSRRCRETQR